MLPDGVSRELNHLHPEMLRRWQWVLAMYRMLWPTDPQPEVSCTFRGSVAQDKEKAEGDSSVGWPNSTHNFFRFSSSITGLDTVPASLAVDFYFNEGGKTSYRAEWMWRVINVAELVGLKSGAYWRLRDLPHLALVEKVPAMMVGWSNQARDTWLGFETKQLPDIPQLPSPARDKLQPVLRYYPDKGNAQIQRGKGDIVIRVEHNPESIDELAVHVRYDGGDEL